MTDKEWFESNPTLDEITGNTEKLNKIIYENIMQKYIKSGEDILNLPHEANDYLVEKSRTIRPASGMTRRGEPASVLNVPCLADTT